MSLHVLGINAFHGGAAACLLRDGVVVAAAEEERFTRVKYTADYPTHAIRWCLAAGGVAPQELDHIAISRDPASNLLRRMGFVLRRWRQAGYLLDRVRNQLRVASPERLFRAALGSDGVRLRATFHHVEHHRAHLASAFFVSPFEDAAILSIDGMGDLTSTMWGYGSGRHIRVDGAVHYPHSLGYLYTAVSQWLGFPNYGDEGKVMGLAPYGAPTRMEDLRRLVHPQRDGTFELGLEFFRHATEGMEMTWSAGTPVIGRMFGDRMVELLGAPRSPGEPIERRHEDVAASLQAVLEEAELALLEKIHRETGSTRLCLAGGVALNSVMNGKIRGLTPFRDVFVQPAAGDAGTALGAAAWVHHQVLGHPRAFVMRHAFTGPSYEGARLRQALDAAGASWTELDGVDTVAAAAARRVASGQVVGWFQGAMEWGPRALGNRSIVADPRSASMKDVLNARIKQREPFRPFAPSVLEEATAAWFEQDWADPFMVTVAPVRQERRDQLAAVTHVDGSARVQTVAAADAPRYAALIRACAAETGVPAVLNTSFNENEPIVRTPEEALDCFARTRMDVLVLGDFLVERS